MHTDEDVTSGQRHCEDRLDLAPLSLGNAYRIGGHVGSGLSCLYGLHNTTHPLSAYLSPPTLLFRLLWDPYTAGKLTGVVLIYADFQVT